MNYYERIQRSIDFCEERLGEEIGAEDMAGAAFMSLSGFHRIFFALTGYTAAEYLRNRRISRAAQELLRGRRVLDAALDFGYESADAFSRAFKNVTGCLPGGYARGEKRFVFERIDLMEKYYAVQEEELLENYPDIKVLKELPPMRVAYYCYFGKEPESGAFAVMSEWARRNGMSPEEGHRIFGYNAPGTELGDTEYGYEVCVTIPEDYTFADERVRSKTLSGGTYVVCHVDRDSAHDMGEGIVNAWKRLSSWLKGSRYIYGKGQWLEEHLEFDENMAHVGGIDLYMPVSPRKEIQTPYEAVNLEDRRVVYAEAKGRNAMEEAFRTMMEAVKQSEVKLSESWLFSFYNFESAGTDAFFFRLYLSTDQKITGEKLQEAIFPGGMFACKEVIYSYNAASWFQFMGDLESSERYCMERRPFLERYLTEDGIITGETRVRQYLPVGPR